MISLAQWRDQGCKQSILDHDIFVLDTKTDRPVILFLHGFPTSSWDWTKVWQPLSENFRLICFDFLGFGFSAKPSRHQYSIFEQANIAEAVLDACGVSRCHIFAHDYGDTVAQELLARKTYQETDKQFDSFCFLNGGLFPESHRARFVQSLLLSPLGSLVSRLNSKRSFQKSFAAVFAAPPVQDEMDNYWAAICETEGNKIMHKLLHYIPERKAYRHRWVGAMQETECPLRFINGSVDPVSGKHMADRYRELIPLPDVIDLPQVGHYPQMEAPDDVLRAFLDFIKKAA